MRQRFFLRALLPRAACFHPRQEAQQGDEPGDTIERQPAQLRLAILTREDLPLAVAQLRVRRQVVEIR